MSGRQVELGCDRPVLDGAVDHEPARLGAAAGRGDRLAGDIDRHIEGPFGENLGPEDALLTDVGAEQEMHQLHEAGLASAIAAQQTVAINAATARLNDTTNDFASRRMDRNIRRALAGQKISDL